MQTFAVDECIPSVATTKNVKKIPLYGKLLTKKNQKVFSSALNQSKEV